MNSTRTNAIIVAAATVVALWSCDDGSNVGPDKPVATVTLTPAAATTAPGGMAQLQAVTRDAAGVALTDREIIWASSADAVATVSATGLVTGVADGSTTITATSEGKAGSAVITVATPTTLTFTAISTSISHTCGITPAGAAYCWGYSLAGELGDGTTTASQQLKPVLVAGGVSFASITTGDSHSCGISAEGAGYCWGWNLEGEVGVGANTGPELCALGNGFSVPCSSVPVALAGNLRFSSISSGGVHSCGITAAGAAYCWGHNFYSQLGVGTTTGPETCPRSDIPDIVPCSTLPVQVVGGVSFASVSAGGTHSCGVTVAGTAYCWGYGIYGELGDGSTTPRASPVQVAGGLSFASVSAGTYHTCGVTTSGAAYCWGSNQAGGLGNGDDMLRSSPVPVLVAGGLSFASVSAGEHYTCGVTVGGAAYCWGHGEPGQLGNGDINQQLTPVRVAGGLSFAVVSAGQIHTCGITTAGVAYCWGSNHNGQLGDGTTTQRLTPVLVSGG